MGGPLKKKVYKKSFVKDSHNCYSYFLNEVDYKHAKDCKKIKKLWRNVSCLRPQPGAASGMPDIKIGNKKKQYTCKNMIKRTISDNKSIYRTSRKKPCKKNYYKGALFIDKGVDFHFYREDKPGKWSHKQGSHIGSDVDAKGKPIKNPEKAAKKYKSKRKNNVYDKFCSYFCIPRKTKKKMSIYKNKNGKSVRYLKLLNTLKKGNKTKRRMRKSSRSNI